MTDKVAEIRSHLAPLLGSTIARYETAELLLDDGTWGRWPDLPIRIFVDNDRLVSLSWSRFDDLWIAADRSLPFPVEGTAVRWVANSIEGINPCVGATIRGAMLGLGGMTWGGVDVEIWTRLLIELDRGWLEVFNALDENGYEFHERRPEGRFVPCLGD